jgi:hypothetical protein
MEQELQQIGQALNEARLQLSKQHGANAHGFVGRVMNNKDDSLWDIAEKTHAYLEKVVADLDKALAALQRLKASVKVPSDIQGTGVVHELKCHPEPYQAVKRGDKPFEFRKDDRGFNVGDTLWLREWDPKRGYDFYIPELPESNSYTGDECRRLVTYIIREGFGIPEGYCIMGFGHPPSLSVDGGWISDAEIERAKASFINEEEPQEWPVQWDMAVDGFEKGLRYYRDHILKASPPQEQPSIDQP